MRRRRLFALFGGASAAATLPAIAAPMVEMHAADVTPIVERYVSDFGTLHVMPPRAFTEELLKRVIKDCWDRPAGPPAGLKSWLEGSANG